MAEPKTKRELERAISQLSRIKSNQQLWVTFKPNMKRAISSKLNAYKKRLATK